MLQKLLTALLVCLVSVSVYAAPKKAQVYEKNRLEIIKPMKAGELLLRPTFNSCGFYFGIDKVESPVLEFRKKGSSKWRTAFAPVHFFEDGNTTSGLVMNEYRGSIVKLEENTAYEIRFRDGDNVLKSLISSAIFMSISCPISFSAQNGVIPPMMASPIIPSGTGTLCALPISLPSSSGITKPIALAAPVELGTILIAAALARLKSPLRCGPSSNI